MMAPGKYYMIFMILFAATGAAAQQGPVLKVYAYQRAVLPGTVPTQSINENGTVTEKKPGVQYTRYIYLEHKRSRENIRVLKIWIRQTPYTAGVEKISRTPVVISNGDTDKDTLVPKTAHAVLQVLPGEPQQKDELPASLKESVARNELVILYACGKRMYHSSVRQLKNLSSFILQ